MFIISDRIDPGLPPLRHRCLANPVEPEAYQSLSEVSLSYDHSRFTITALAVS